MKCAKNIYVHTDRNSLYRIIFNLFENASKYGQEVNITVKRHEKRVVIDIEDDGPGIDQEFRKKVFKPFYKIDESRNLNKGGSGLGLSIANELAKKIKAKINLKHSRNLDGSLFSIILPIKK